MERAQEILTKIKEMFEYIVNLIKELFPQEEQA